MVTTQNEMHTSEQFQDFQERATTWAKYNGDKKVMRKTTKVPEGVVSDRWDFCEDPATYFVAGVPLTTAIFAWEISNKISDFEMASKLLQGVKDAENLINESYTILNGVSHAEAWEKYPAFMQLHQEVQKVLINIRDIKISRIKM